MCMASASGVNSAWPDMRRDWTNKDWFAFACRHPRGGTNTGQVHSAVSTNLALILPYAGLGRAINGKIPTDLAYVTLNRHSLHV